MHGPQSLDGLLTDDGREQPRSVWWAYKAYGAVNGTLLAVNSTATADGAAAFDQGGGGSGGGSEGALLSLVLSVKVASASASASAVAPFCGPGTHHGSGPDNNVTSHDVDFRNLTPDLLEPGGLAVTVAVASIPNSGAAAMVGAPLVKSRQWPVVDSTATVRVSLPGSDGAVALVLLGRRAGEAAAAFATVPR